MVYLGNVKLQACLTFQLWQEIYQKITPNNILIYSPFKKEKPNA